MEWNQKSLGLYVVCFTCPFQMCIMCWVEIEGVRDFCFNVHFDGNATKGCIKCDNMQEKENYTAIFIVPCLFQ